MAHKKNLKLSTHPQVMTYSVAQVVHSHPVQLYIHHATEIFL